VVAPDEATGGTVSADAFAGNDEGFSGKRNIAMRDDCDPRDPAWTPTGGCTLRRGVVTFAEFNAENNSPLAAAVIGHMAWRMDPTYIRTESGKTIRVRNEGGRTHTFTRVAQFGGGKIPSPDLNKGLATAPECPGSIDIAPGGRTEVSGLTAGNNRFQCCIHPWMRAIIKVRTHADHDD
jgi:plastocyanin